MRDGVREMAREIGKSSMSIIKCGCAEEEISTIHWDHGCRQVQARQGRTKRWGRRDGVDGVRDRLDRARRTDERQDRTQLNAFGRFGSCSNQVRTPNLSRYACSVC